MIAAPAIVEYGPTFREFLGGIVVAPDGTVWAQECNGAVRLTRDGSIREFRRSDDGEPSCGAFGNTGIGIGPDGAVWTNGYDRLLRFSGQSVRGSDVAPARDYRDAIVGFAADATGVYFSRLSSPGVTRIDAGGARTFLPSAAPIASIASGGGTLWLETQSDSENDEASADGLIVRGGGRTQTGVLRDYMQTHTLSARAVAADGTLVAASTSKTEGGQPIEVSRFSPDGSVRSIATVANPGYYPGLGGIAVASDGVWLTEPYANRVARIDPHGTVHAFRDGIPMNAQPNGIALDRDGSVWFTDDGRNTIEHLRPDGRVRVYGNGLRPDNIPGGPVVTGDGAIWFRETLGWRARIARIAPDGTLSEFPDPGALAPAVLQPYGDGVAVVGSSHTFNGGAIAYAIARDGTTRPIDTSGCLIAQVNFACLPQLRDRGPLQYRGDAQSVTVGPDGNLWFTDVGNGAIGRIARDGSLRLFTRGLTRYNSGPQYITRGPGGALWFTEVRDRIGRVTVDGRITEFAHRLPARSYAGGIVAGRDGNLWFTLYHGNELARMTTDGVVTRFRQGIYPSRGNDTLVVDSVPSVDAQGRIWFNEPQGGRIARATIPTD